jgi:hypothetical protein
MARLLRTRWFAWFVALLVSWLAGGNELAALPRPQRKQVKTVAAPVDDRPTTPDAMCGSTMPSAKGRTPSQRAWCGLGTIGFDLYRAWILAEETRRAQAEGLI